MEHTENTLPCPKIVRGQEKLMPEQEEYAHQFAQERITVMLSTDPIDEGEAEEHLRAAYRVAGREPVPVRWFDSPISFVLAPVSDVVTSIGDNVEVSVGYSVRDDIGVSVRNNIGDSIWTRVGDSIWTHVEDSIWDSIGYSVWSSVGASVETRVWTRVGDSVRAYYHEHWHSFYRFFHEVFEPNDLIHLALFNEMVSGFRVGSNEAWVVRKPIRVERDEQGRLHCIDGLCLQYQDGWGFYAWHGVEVPKKVILSPEQITKEDWLKENNQEIRRIIQERLGPDRFIALVGGSCFDRGPRGELISVDLGNDPERVARYIHVQDASTERQYYLRVPPTIQSADEAVAWTFGLSAQEYQPEQET